MGCGTELFSTAPHGAGWPRAMRYGTALFSTAPHGAGPSRAMVYGTARGALAAVHVHVQPADGAAPEIKVPKIPRGFK